MHNILLLSILSFFGIASAVHFTVKNPEYSKPYSSLHKWKHIAEPYVSSELTGVTKKEDVDDLKYVWNIAGNEFEGETVTFTFTSLGYHQVTLSLYSKNTGKLYAEKSEDVMVKYVRREIRDLSQSDRERFLNAFKTIYTVKTEDGAEKYGSKYRDIYYFMKKHIYGAASRSCDHWHDDTGIIVHHVAFTLELEQSLQAVDSAVTMPYWSYPEDVLTYDDWTESNIFSSEMFGSANPGGDMHVVDDSRWAYTEIPILEEKIPLITNPYGIMRSPWNVNAAPFLTRNTDMFGIYMYDTLPSCAEFKACIDSDTIHTIYNCLNGDTHGPVHIMIGGQWGSSQDSVLRDFSLVEFALLTMKDLWRQGWVRCPGTCSPDGIDVDTGKACECYVPDELLAQHGAYNILRLSGALHWLVNPSPLITWNARRSKYEIEGYAEGDEENAMWELLLQALANPGSVGEMYTSASPWDPTFWIIHPESERLLNYKLLTTDKDDFDRSWGYEHTSTPSDTGLVCDWTGVGDAPELPFCTKGICPGHMKEDLIPFSNFLGKSEIYTNWEFFEFSAPDNDEYPYIYDNFEWSLCEENGIELGE